jgi:hypothetical protein
LWSNLQCIRASPMFYISIKLTKIEEKMKKPFGFANPFFLTTLAGLGLMALIALPANAAKKTDIYRCKGDRSEVHACCNSYIERGMLLKIWKRTRRNCETQVVCADKEGNKCFVKRPPEPPEPPESAYCRLHPELCGGRKPNPNEETIKGGGSVGGGGSGGDGGDGGDAGGP